MKLSEQFQPFVQASPMAVMARGVVENVLGPDQIDALFEQTAEVQYTRDLLFSTVTGLMGQVVFDLQPSIRAAYQDNAEEIGVSITSVYNKLNGVELGVSAALVRQSASQLAPVVSQLKAELPPLLEGYRVKILDGSHFPGTEHRIQELRSQRAAALPGQALVVLDPQQKLAVDVFPCEDGHAQERALVPQVLETVEPGDVWLGDRNFCTSGFLFGVMQRQARFVIRQHGSTLSWQPMGRRRFRGETNSGRVYEQKVRLSDPAGGRTRTVRRITVELFQPTRDGQTVIHVLTNLPVKAASATRVAELYRQRWKIETMFQELTETLEGEIKPLGYPPAAIFGYCLALVAYNSISVVFAALRAIFGRERVAQDVSVYYVALEISRTTPGMQIALPAESWRVFAEMTPAGLVRTLKWIARHVKLAKYQKHPRGPKKPKPKKESGAKIKHVSTARILAARN